MLQKEILLGVCGGIAAYKVPELVRLLRAKGLAVTVAMTKNAETFVTPTTLHTVSERRVLTAHWDREGDPLDHINAARRPALALIAPATANFIAKLATGIADDFLSTLAVALSCPLYVAPSMNPTMYQHASVQANLETLRRRGVHVIEPETGDTACGEEGKGRLPAPETLAAVVEKALGLTLDYAGKTVIVTAGRTEEPIDAVRYISNRSSGKMGIALAEAARDRGARVILIHGAVSHPLPEGVERVEARTAQAMCEAVERLFPSGDLLVMAAAVADFRPVTAQETKLKKEEGAPSLALEKTPDILERAGRMKHAQVLVGFAAETENVSAHARKKLMQKKLDMICANDVSRADIGFDSDFNEITFLFRDGTAKTSPRLPKEALAHLVLDEAASLIRGGRTRAAAGND